MVTFSSSKNLIMVSLLWLTVISLLITPFIPDFGEENLTVEIIGFIIIYAVCGLLIWILVDTKYRLNKQNLYYYCGPFRGNIPVDKIRKIERWNKWYVTSSMKPALDSDGFIIYYEKFDDIYISPKNKENFIKILLEINPNIEVI
ncbi:MAG: hypothetical protein EOP00_28725 [Pedobacter sp.]|nr:MAG: hypothetical protein EOP00_28725 [Pedobacter sp.]